MLENKRIIVTGCGRGMGEATLLAYVAAGAKVVGMDINQKLGTAVVTQANANASDQAHFLPVDVANEQNVTEAFHKAVELLGGGLDVLAHPAAIQAASDPSEVSAETWDQMFAVNVRGTMLANQAAHRHMRLTGGGSIINFGSISGQRAEPHAVAYSASKGAVHSWTRSAAAAWGADKIRVNAILPAMVTPMYREARKHMTDDQNTTAYWSNHHPIALGKAYGDPLTDLGPVMIFFASDASHFITGQLIPVDGGQTNTR